jgi:hypothetical protein
MSPLRKHFGLRWRKSYPTPSDFRWGDVAVLVAVIVGYLIVALVDTRNEAAISAAQAQQAGAQFASFVNGGALVSDDGHFAAKCERLIEVTN